MNRESGVQCRLMRLLMLVSSDAVADADTCFIKSQSINPVMRLLMLVTVKWCETLVCVGGSVRRRRVQLHGRWIQRARESPHWRMEHDRERYQATEILGILADWHHLTLNRRDLSTPLYNDVLPATMQCRKSGLNSGGRRGDAEGWSVGRCTPSHRGGGQKKWIFTWNCVFWCILSGTFLSVSLPKKCWIIRMMRWFGGRWRCTFGK